MPIIGVIDSAKTGRLSNPAYYSIATATPSGTSYTFSGIPSTYTHLQLRCVTYFGSGSADSTIQMNGGNGSQGMVWECRGNSKGSGTNSSTATGIYFTDAYWSGYTNFSNVTILDIYDYTNANKYKTFKAEGANSTSSSTSQTVIYGCSGTFTTLSAINSITLNAASSWQSGTQFALYGVK